MCRLLLSRRFLALSCLVLCSGLCSTRGKQQFFVFCCAPCCVVAIAKTPPGRCRRPWYNHYLVYPANSLVLLAVDNYLCYIPGTSFRRARPSMQYRPARKKTAPLKSACKIETAKNTLSLATPNCEEKLTARSRAGAIYCGRGGRRDTLIHRVHGMKNTVKSYVLTQRAHY